MQIRKTEEEVANVRLERINKMKKNDKKKGYDLFFDENNNSMNSSNSSSQKIYTKKADRKNITLRMKDFPDPDNEQNQPEEQPSNNSNIKYLSYFLYFFSFLFYKQSLFSCDNFALNECIELYNIKTIFICLLKCILSGIILSINLVFIFSKLVSIMHLFVILGVLLFFLCFDYGNDIYSHGIINFIILFLSMIIGLVLIVNIYLSIHFFKEGKYRISLLMASLVIIIIAGLNIGFYFFISCDYWSKGLKEIEIDNNKKKYSCKMKTPKLCYINGLNGIFDFSKLTGYICEDVDFKFGDVITNLNLYYDTGFDENITVLNYPFTNNENFSKNEYDNQNNLAREVFANIKGGNNKDYKNSEVFLMKNDFGHGYIEMKINKNYTLIEERNKILTNPKIKNILFIYLDSLSRPHFHRQFSSLSSLLQDLYANSHLNFESFQFLKYHIFDESDQYLNTKSINSLFYGQDILYNTYNNITEKPQNILTHLKQNGFITGQSSNICSKHLSSYHKILNEEFDHENIAMFCDLNYNMVNKKNANIKGINSVLRRCLYGKDSFEYVLEYGKLFWETYSDNKKFLRLGFFDGNERTGEVVKYLDGKLTDFIIDIINNGRFYRTALFFVSSKGGIEYGIFDKMKYSEFFHEKNLGTFFILMNKYGMNETILNNMRNNVQIFVTPYDVYDSLLSIIYDCYNQECFDKIKFKSKNGNSIFNEINGYERNCDTYNEIKDSNCQCKKY